MRLRICVIAFVVVVAPNAPPYAATVCEDNCSISSFVSVGSFGGGDGTLVVAGPEHLIAPNGAAVGAIGPGTGSLTVSGANSRMDIGGAGDTAGPFPLFVGTDGGSGYLFVVSGGALRVTRPNASNIATQANVGVGGFGEIRVGSGGLFEVSEPAATGGAEGIQLGFSTAAAEGFGNLFVSDPASILRVTGNNAFVHVAASSGAVGTASHRIAFGVLSVKNGGRAEILAHDGYALLAAGSGGSSVGLIEISGLDSEIVVQGPSANVVLAGGASSGGTGFAGQGNIGIGDGGRLNVLSGSRGGVTIGHGLGYGRITIRSGGLLNVQGDIYVSAKDEIGNDEQGGNLDLLGGTVVASGTTFVGSGRSQHNGFLYGAGVLSSDVAILAGGRLSPGLIGGSRSLLTVNGDLWFDGGWLEIEAAGSGAGMFDTLRVNGDVDLTDGVVRIIFTDGFSPDIGDEFEVVVAGTISGFAATQFQYENAPGGAHFAAAVLNATGGGGQALVIAAVAPPNEPPTITLSGANAMTVAHGSVFADPGASADDPEDGDLTAEIVVDNPVNTGAAGIYVVTYSVLDSAGASAQAARTVTVQAPPPPAPPPPSPPASGSSGGGGGGSVSILDLLLLLLVAGASRRAAFYSGHRAFVPARPIDR